MATIKSYTDISQSKKLAEILPTESADMYYISGDGCDICFGRGVYEEIADWICEGMSKPADVPCWSLTALLNTLPNGIVMNKDSQNGRYHFSSTHIGTYVIADNPIDACVAIIEKLHELKML